MALDKNKYIVSAPNISPTDLQTLFGDTNLTVCGACLSTKINQWSRYKPIFLAGRTGVNFHFREMGYDPEYHGLVSKFYSTWSELGQALVKDGTLAPITDWTYDRVSLKTTIAPKRIGDFDGYWHKATPPFDGFFCPPVLSNSNNTNQDAYLVFELQEDVGTSDNAEIGSIGLPQIAVPAVTGSDTLLATTLDKFYFGVALINKSGAIKWAKTETVASSSSGSIEHSYMVSMALKDMGVTAGVYYAVPVLSRVQISEYSEEPEQVCLVPNCSPVQIEVTTSEVVNEDIEVVFTRCVYIPVSSSSGESDQGAIFSNIRVTSKASYDKKCTYIAYTMLNGGTAQSNIETGEFNLAQGGLYTIEYNNVSATREEASKMTVGVTVKAKKADGVTVQSVSATRIPIVPLESITES